MMFFNGGGDGGCFIVGFGPSVSKIGAFSVVLGDSMGLASVENIPDPTPIQMNIRGTSRTARLTL